MGRCFFVVAWLLCGLYGSVAVCRLGSAIYGLGLLSLFELYWVVLLGSGACPLCDSNLLPTTPGLLLDGSSRVRRMAMARLRLSSCGPPFSIRQLRVVVVGRLF